MSTTLPEKLKQSESVQQAAGQKTPIISAPEVNNLSPQMDVENKKVSLFFVTVF
jgi:hypothetical protein